ncbi:MAG TPA: DUF2231 domain-containing protein [Gaiellaceae bacterium]|nr:DUF2231 domain-containing protein [Gaiellaceae bacterium]
MKLSFLWKGFAGHPLHPPLTDATIGSYTFATVMAVVSWLGVSDANTATAWWLALITGLVITVPTALAGFADWLEISRGTPLWRTATLHLAAMVTATVVFAVAAGAGHGDYVDREISGSSLVLTLIAFGVLTLGGWLGGANVFVHGMRVLSLVDEQTARAVAPVPYAEKEEAEEGGR